LRESGFADEDICQNMFSEEKYGILVQATKHLQARYGDLMRANNHK